MIDYKNLLFGLFFFHLTIQAFLFCEWIIRNKGQRLTKMCKYLKCCIIGMLKYKRNISKTVTENIQFEMLYLHKYLHFFLKRC